MDFVNGLGYRNIYRKQLIYAVLGPFPETIFLYPTPLNLVAAHAFAFRSQVPGWSLRYCELLGVGPAPLQRRRRASRPSGELFESLPWPWVPRVEI